MHKEVENKTNESKILKALLQPLPTELKNKKSAVNGEIEFSTDSVMEEPPAKKAKKIRLWSEKTLANREKRKAETARKKRTRMSKSRKAETYIKLKSLMRKER